MIAGLLSDVAAPFPILRAIAFKRFAQFGLSRGLSHHCAVTPRKLHKTSQFEV